MESWLAWLSFLQQAEAHGEPRLTGDSSMTLREAERREPQHPAKQTRQTRHCYKTPKKKTFSHFPQNAWFAWLLGQAAASA
jgi:hypothetical protein